MKIGVASSDGIVVNSHFGKAAKFYIYETAEDGNITLLGERKVIPVCNGGDHDDAQLAHTVDSLKDLDFVIVSRIGQGARNALLNAGVGSYELPMLIEDAIHKMTAYQEVQNLIAGVAKSGERIGNMAIGEV